MMKKMLLKIGAGLVASGLVVSLLAPGAIAQDSEISGNGENSVNEINVSVTNNCTVKQKNDTEVLTEATVKAKTGNNTASGNVSSDVSIDTGDAIAELEITVGGGSNTINTDPCCPCNTDPTVSKIKDNGPGSTNTINASKTNTKTVKQKNKTSVATGATVKAKTGNNDASGNTGGTVGITTGKATSKFKVTVTPPSNTMP